MRTNKETMQSLLLLGVALLMNMVLIAGMIASQVRWHQNER
jgi:hypothetical protein